MDENKGLNLMVWMLGGFAVILVLGVIVTLISPPKRETGVSQNTPIPIVTKSTTFTSQDIQEIDSLITEADTELSALEKEISDLETALSTNAIDDAVTQFNKIQ